MKNHPPRFSSLMLRIFLRREAYLEKAGDLEEVYSVLVEEVGPFRAKVWFWSQVLKAMPGFIANTICWRCIMFKNYLKIACRYMKRDKIYSVINLAGLTLGLTCCILIYCYLQYELSYDKFNQDYQNIYRLTTRQAGNVYMGTDSWSTTPALLASTMKQDFPEVILGTRIATLEGIVSFQERKHSEILHFVDPDFLDIFSYKMIRQNQVTPLSEPFAVLLTREMANKYFGNEDPVGKTLFFDNRHEFKINGIIDSPPGNSHLQFDFLASISSLRTIIGGDQGERYLNRWGSADFYSYVKLRNGTNPHELEEKLTAFRLKYEGENSRNNFHLQPLADIHLHSHLNFEISSNSYMWYLYLFASIGIFILLIACFNYMNLTTAKSLQRIKEVGIRKVVGADRHSLMKQFLSESMIFATAALFLALIISGLFLPRFGTMVERDIPFSLFEKGSVLAGIAVIYLFIGLFSGSYPAFYLSRLRPIGILKGEASRGSKGKTTVRNLLVMIQFVISISLLVCAQVIYKQRDYIRNRDLGFQKDHILYTYIRDPELRKNCEPLKKDWLNISRVLDITASENLPLTIRSGGRFGSWEGKPEGEYTLGIYRTRVDYNFFDFYGIKILQGRVFSKKFPTDQEEAYIINETVAKSIGWDEPIGQRFSWGRRGMDGRIIGVIKDFHFFPLHMQIDGLAIKLSTVTNYISVKISTDGISKTIASLEGVWKKHSPNYPFEYGFIDDRIDQLYRTEQKLGVSFNYFTGMAIFIACLGLFGLASYTAQHKTKEIGIRKVLGASLLQIFLLLSGTFLKWVTMAAAFSVPVAFYGMDRWLQHFAYRTSIRVWPFIIAVSATLIIALITISLQSIKSAKANPIDSLRYE